MLRAVRRLPQVWRVALPLAAAVVCLLASRWVGPFPSYILVMVSLALILDAVLAMMPTTGGLWAHRQ